MAQSEKYVEGQWYVWSGGECPVHPETVVDVVMETTKGFATLYEKKLARWWVGIEDDEAPTIAFRVVKHYVEPRVIWVNEYYANGCTVYQTKEDAEKWAEKYAKRIAVRYVETPE